MSRPRILCPKIMIFRPTGEKITLDMLGYFLYSVFRWDINSSGYLYRKMGKNKNKMFHRQLIDAEDKQIVDHINNDPLDNRMSNLRFATKSQNAINRKIPPKGIRKRSEGCWQARFMKEGKEIHLGSFKTQQEAKEAYLKEHIRHFGEFSPHAKKNLV